ncbi:MAG: nucleotidyltransferase [Candidatus Falkowbacteria bacterium]|nr:nucleotidyltransferase [Candidatus Falkowbacteria bacterium]
MEIKLEEKKIEGLRWIVDILERNNVPYKIGGGLAAKVYGSEREVNDIDISLSGKYFDAIIAEASDFITAGPKHYLNEKWDCNTLSVNYNGQEIDMTDVDTLLMSNLDQTQWLKVKERRLYDAVVTNINGLMVSIMDPRDLLSYKQELGGEHQSIDIEAIKKYLNK